MKDISVCGSCRFGVEYLHVWTKEQTEHPEHANYCTNGWNFDPEFEVEIKLVVALLYYTQKAYELANRSPSGVTLFPSSALRPVNEENNAEEREIEGKKEVNADAADLNVHNCQRANSNIMQINGIHNI